MTNATIAPEVKEIEAKLVGILTPKLKASEEVAIELEIPTYELDEMLTLLKAQGSEALIINNASQGFEVGLADVDRVKSLEHWQHELKPVIDIEAADQTVRTQVSYSALYTASEEGGTKFDGIELRLTTKHPGVIADGVEYHTILSEEQAIVLSQTYANPYHWVENFAAKLADLFHRFGATDLKWEPETDEDVYREQFNFIHEGITIKIDEHCTGKFQGYVLDAYEDVIYSTPGLSGSLFEAHALCVTGLHKQFRTFEDGQRGSLPFEWFTQHPANSKIYGYRESVDDVIEWFNKPAEERWIDEFTTNLFGQLIAANRRWLGCWRMKYDPAVMHEVQHHVDFVPYVCEVLPSPAAEAQRVVRKNLGRDKTSLQKIREGMILEESYREIATDNIRKGALRSAAIRSGTIEAGENLPHLEEVKNLKTREAVGQEIGMSGKSYEKGKRVILKLDQYRSLGENELADALETIAIKSLDSAAQLIAEPQEKQLEIALRVVGPTPKARSIKEAIEQVSGVVRTPRRSSGGGGGFGNGSVTPANPPANQAQGSTAVAAAAVSPSQQQAVAATGNTAVITPSESVQGGGGGSTVLTPPATGSGEGAALVTPAQVANPAQSDEFPYIQTEDGRVDQPTDNWLSPELGIELGRQVLGVIHVDPFASSTPETKIGSELNLTFADNCFERNWCRPNGEPANIFTNIAYSQSEKAFKKFAEQLTARVPEDQKDLPKEQQDRIANVANAIVIAKEGVLFNKGSGKLIAKHFTAVCFWGSGEKFNGRMKFIPGDYLNKFREFKQLPPISDNPDFDIVFLYAGDNPQLFREVFSPYGDVRPAWSLVDRLQESLTQQVLENQRLLVEANTTPVKDSNAFRVDWKGENDKGAWCDFNGLRLTILLGVEGTWKVQTGKKDVIQTIVEGLPDKDTAKRHAIAHALMSPPF